jgi:hypothetical protein
MRRRTRVTGNLAQSRIGAKGPMSNAIVTTLPSRSAPNFGAATQPSPLPRKSVADFSVGDRVLHAKFGAGNVTSTDRKGRLVVAFDRVGEKRVVPDFLTGSAKIIPFPTGRIVRHIRHGKGIVVPQWLNEAEVAELAAEALPLPPRPRHP